MKTCEKCPFCHQEGYEYKEYYCYVPYEFRQEDGCDLRSNTIAKLDFLAESVARIDLESDRIESQKIYARYQKFLDKIRKRRNE